MKKYSLPALIALILFTNSLSYALAELNPLLEASRKYQNIKVDQVLSVDTLLLEGNQKIVLIGLVGLKPPKAEYAERDDHGFIVPEKDPTTPLEVEAFRFVRNLVEQKNVRLEFDAERRDENGRLEAYVFLSDGKFLNEEIIRQGYAQLKLQAPNVKYSERFRKAYQEARREMRGLQGNW